MSFYARNFIFNGIPSQTLGLTISSENAEDSTNAGSDVEPKIIKIYRRPTNYIVGVEQSPELTYPVSFNSESFISATFAAQIEQKLFGQMGYKKLQVIQPDMDSFYWNCFLKSPQMKTVGGQIVGWNATVECDSPWAKSFERTLPYNYTSALSASALMYNNRSGNNDYSFPNLQFTMNNAGGNFIMYNTTDANRFFMFTGLSPNEVITVDNERQIITSSPTGINRLPNFNKHWFRVKPGRNDLLLYGNISQLKIIYTDAQKIGG